MPLVVGLGLSALDKSLFGFKRSERTLTSPGPDEEPAVRDVNVRLEIEAPPTLPPLGVLEWNNSFTNILNRIEVQPSSRVNRTSTQRTVLRFVPVADNQAASSSETLRPHNASSPQPMASTDIMTTDNSGSNFTKRTSDARPERHQSSTSTASYSRRSHVSSVLSASSSSSVDDVSESCLQHINLDPSATHSHSTDLFVIDFLDVKLDLDLTPSYASSIPSPVLNTNKPLPRAPSALGWTQEDSPYATHLPELDSAPAQESSSFKKSHATNRSSIQELYPHSANLMRRSKSSLCLPIGESSTPTTPRRNSARSRPRSQRIKKDTKQEHSESETDQALCHILLRVGSLSDLKSTALINKAFYRVFKRHEAEIVESVLKIASPPAWQLRSLVKQEHKRNAFQIKAVQRDLEALRALEAFILMKCQKICRSSTLQGLSGSDERHRKKVEDALWRIWTFCKLFGKGTSRDSGIHAQMLWLEGFVPRKKSNQNKTAPVSKSELEDMSEMWRCMESLLSGFRGREPEAREAGIFDYCSVSSDDGKSEAQYLEDWIYDILSVGPKAVLTMISCSFEHAKVLGVNKWNPPRPGKCRRTFLKAALEQVYRDRLVEDARLQADNFSKTMRSQSASDRSSAVASEPADVPERATSAPPSDLRKLKPDRPNVQTHNLEPEPSSAEIRPDCDPEATLPENKHQIPTISPSSNPTAYSSIGMTSNASTRFGATLFPMPSNTTTQRRGSGSLVYGDQHTRSESIDLEDKVIDPSDRALSLLVKQLGFSEHLAKQALAMSDDGAGIDVQRAVELLSEDRRLDPGQKAATVSELPTGDSQHLVETHPAQEYCEGTCRRVSVLQRKRSHLRSLMSRNSVRQSFPLSVIMDRADEGSAVHRLARTALSPTMPISMPTVHEDVPETKSGYANLAEFLKYRSNLRSHNSIRSQYSFLRGHKKSSSTGTLDHSEPDTERSLSPVSPITPSSSLGGFTAIRPQYESIDDQLLQAKPRVTLTRVGTGRKPSKRVSFMRQGSRKYGEEPEIIGFAY